MKKGSIDEMEPENPEKDKGEGKINASSLNSGRNSARKTEKEELAELSMFAKFKQINSGIL